MARSRTVLVTGGTGKTGRRVAERLVELGFTVRVASRKATPASAGGAEQVRFDWSDEATHAPALAGVDGIYLVAPVGVLDPAPIMIPFLSRAAASGVRRMVLLSASALPEGAPALGQVHRAVREIAPEWAVLQPSWFMQNFTEGQHGATINRDGEIVTATGDGKVGFVDADDIAEVGVRALSDEQPHNAAHVITGPEALSYADAAAIISAVAGRPIRHRATDAAEMRRRMVEAGIAEGYAALLASLDEGIRAGGEDRVTSTVERVTGRPPRSLSDFAAANATFWERR